MFDISWGELLLVLVVALVVVGPKDLPKLMRKAGQWVGRARAMADQFRKSFDEMARQSELDELRAEVEQLKMDRPLSELENEANALMTGPDEPSEPYTNVEDPVEETAHEPAADKAPVIKPTPEEEAALEKTKAPLLEHLIELRSRLVKSLAVFFVAFIGCYWLAQPIYAFLVQPLADALAGQPDRHLIFTALYETFFTYVKIGMWGGLCLAFPYMAAQLWMFVAPGLYRHERRAFLPFLAATPVMFIVGAAFVYYVIMPYAIRFFLSFESPAGEGPLPIQLEAKVGEYLSFVMTLIFAFGLCFEMPVLLTLLGRVGIVTSKQLGGARRYAIVGIFAVAAVITPPDAFSMVALAIPLVGLYEISILCVKLIERKRAAATAAEAPAG